MPLILSIEDDKDIQELIRYNLVNAGHEVMLAGNGRQGLQCVESRPPALILLDIMFPGIGLNGLELCRRLRANNSTMTIPIIMLTARAGETDVIAGLEAGADDYLPKPFSPPVLIARINALLRRAGKPFSKQDPLTAHNLTINTQTHDVYLGKKRIGLSMTEFAILEFFARNPGWVFSRRQLIDGVKGSNYPVTERSIDVQIFGLRKKLGADADFIETVRGMGYRFKSE